jgi:hypothetical protein
MSNVNNYAFANKLQSFKEKILDTQIAKVAKAETIMHDPNYKWESEEKKKTAQAQYDSYKAWLLWYQTFYDEGLRLCTQHENLVNKMSKVYDSWYQNISNEGKQETEMMSMQADLLNELMGELYKELLPLNLPGMKPPQGLNLK